MAAPDYRARLMMADYRAQIVAIRAQRDRELARVHGKDAIAAVRSDARRQIDAVLARRDREIRQLAATGLNQRKIAERIGCSRSTVEEVLDPDLRASNNARRRDHWRALAARARVGSR